MLKERLLTTKKVKNYCAATKLLNEQQQANK